MHYCNIVIIDKYHYYVGELPVNQSIAAIAAFTLLAASCSQETESDGKAPFHSRYKTLADEAEILTS